MVPVMLTLARRLLANACPGLVLFRFSPDFAEDCYVRSFRKNTSIILMQICQQRLWRYADHIDGCSSNEYIRSNQGSSPNPLHNKGIDVRHLVMLVTAKMRIPMRLISDSQQYFLEYSLRNYRRIFRDRADGNNSDENSADDGGSKRQPIGL